MELVLVRVEDHLGLDLKSPRTRMRGDRARISENFDYRRRGAARVRPGFARLVSGTVSVIESDVATDNFNGLSGSLEDDANWTGRGTADIIQALGDTIINDQLGADYQGCEYATGSFDDDQFAEIYIGPVTGAVGGVMLRSNSTNAYWVVNSATTIQILKMTWPGTVVILNNYTAPNWQVASTTGLLRAEILGTVITVYFQGTLVGTLVDTAISSGRPGVALQDASVGSTELDNFRGGDLASGFATLDLESLEPTRLLSFQRDDDADRLVATAGTKVFAFASGGPEWS